MRIGFANGVFDLLHLGHIRFLTECRKHCGYLIVAVNHDKWVREHKGLERPVQGIAKRMEELIETGLVDAAIPFDGYEEGLIVHIKPHVIFRGYDHHVDTSMGTPQLAKGIGCDIVQISQLEGFSTTRILSEAKSNA